MTHWCTWHDSFILIGVCDVTHSYTHSYTWHDSRMYVAWLSHIHRVTPGCMWHDSFITVCDRTHSYIWHDAWIYVTWYNMTPSYMWRHTSVFWYILIYYISFRVRPETILSMTWIKHDIFRESYMWRHTSMYVARLFHIYDITHWFMWDDSCMWVDYYIYAVTLTQYLYHPRSFLDAGFRPRINSFVWFVPSTPDKTTFRFSPIWVTRGRYPQGFSERVRQLLDSKKLSVRYMTWRIDACAMTHLHMWRD